VPALFLAPFGLYGLVDGVQRHNVPAALFCVVWLGLLIFQFMVPMAAAWRTRRQSRRGKVQSR
jgi:hypothetical protein